MRLNEIQISRLLDDARKFVEEDKILHAVQVYRKLILLEPTLMLSYVELASVYAERNYIDAAISTLVAAEPLFSGDPELLFRLGDFYLRAEQYDHALETFRQLIEEKSAPVHYKMGVAMFFLEKFADAEDQFRTALQIDPNLPHVYESIGELLLKRGQFQDAIRYLRKGIVADPFYGVSHFLLGLAHGRLNEWKSAYDEFVLSIDMDPNEPLHWQMCGESLIHLNRLDEAEQYVRKALELDPGSAESVLLLGQINAMRGEYDTSAEWIHKALNLDPENVRAKELLWHLRDSHKNAN